MPHCDCNPSAFRQEKLKWLLEEGREGVWGVNQKYPGPDLPDPGEKKQHEFGAPPQITVHWGVPRELWR